MCGAVREGGGLSQAAAVGMVRRDRFGDFGGRAHM